MYSYIAIFINSVEKFIFLREYYIVQLSVLHHMIKMCRIIVYHSIVWSNIWFNHHSLYMINNPVKIMPILFLVGVSLHLIPLRFFILKQTNVDYCKLRIFAFSVHVEMYLLKILWHVEASPLHATLGDPLYTDFFLFQQQGSWESSWLCL